MKIIKIVVTDEQGVDHVWEGVEGHVNVRCVSHKKDKYQRAVDAHLLLPTEEVNA